MKKPAFTLFELLIVMIIVSMVIILLIKAYQLANFEEKQRKASIYKVINNFQQVSLRSLNVLNKNFPMERYIVDAAGSWEYAVENDKGEEATEQDLLEIFAKNAKFAKLGFDFCNVSDCSEFDMGTASSIPAARWFSEVYIGILRNMQVPAGSPKDTKPQVTTGSCPDYYLPDTEGLVTPPSSEVCWGRLFVDVNGSKQPNKLGEDIYIFGLNEMGIVR